MRKVFVFLLFVMVHAMAIAQELTTMRVRLIAPDTSSVKHGREKGSMEVEIYSSEVKMRKVRLYVLFYTDGKLRAATNIAKTKPLTIKRGSNVFPENILTQAVAAVGTEKGDITSSFARKHTLKEYEVSVQVLDARTLRQLGRRSRWDVATSISGRWPTLVINPRDSSALVKRLVFEPSRTDAQTPTWVTLTELPTDTDGNFIFMLAPPTSTLLGCKYFFYDARNPSVPIVSGQMTHVQGGYMCTIDSRNLNVDNEYLMRVVMTDITTSPSINFADLSLMFYTCSQQDTLCP